MTRQKNTQDKLIAGYKERVKELNCLYQVEEQLRDTESDLEKTIEKIIKIIPSGWQYPEICRVRILLNDKVIQSPGFMENLWHQTAEIKTSEAQYGKITVSYIQEPGNRKDRYFLKEEIKLLNTISDRIAQFIWSKEIKQKITQRQDNGIQESMDSKNEWKPIIELLKKSEKKLYINISQKMLYHLCWIGVESAKQLLEKITIDQNFEGEDITEELNRPLKKEALDKIMTISDDIFDIAANHLNKSLIMSRIQKWIAEDRSRFLVRAIDDPKSSLSDIIEALSRYQHLDSEGVELSPAIDKGLRVSLIRRFFFDQLELINITKQYTEVHDYYDIVQRIISPADSHGKLGGKSAGLFLASKIIEKETQFPELKENIKIPKTWYVSTDGIISFLRYNNLENIYEQKYKETDEIQYDYPNIIQIFKNSYFPPEMIKGLSLALNDFGDNPIIVRSSSLLEDRLGSAFSGKYKSLFLANQGTKQQRMDALFDAISEVYASVFAPDPIEYRKERGLLDFQEEMGILLQEVVGKRVGQYFFPTFAGVSFSNNEFRWSTRIQREDGLARLVPGLGTRAVDRMVNDYPVLISPGNPDHRINLTPDEIAHYSPKMFDVINLENNRFESVEIKGLLKSVGNDIPGIENMVSILQDNHFTTATSILGIDFDKNNLIVTFEGLLNKTPFILQMKQLLTVLKEKMNTPVDIEFAHDGKDFYLLQCRPQSFSKEISPAPIPKDIPENDIVFSANRYISNGHVPDITHIVYVNPDTYNDISDLSELKSVGRTVGRLNKILPKRQFILMGPGRWGSRGDIKLGVNVSYADINNTAMLIEIARKKGNYIPDLSFGTHFFQDLVEASIRYLPLYPDDEKVVFNERFFLSSENILNQILPECSSLEKVIHVIDVPKTNEGKILRILMNADLEEAVGILSDPSTGTAIYTSDEKKPAKKPADDFWLWRMHMVKKIASGLDPQRFGVKGLYVFGSTKNATSGPASDIDLLIHFNGSDKQKEALQHWLEGWSLTLAEQNYLRTGYQTDGLLDIHFVTDKDIKNKTSYAAKIGAITDAAMPLPLMDQQTT